MTPPASTATSHCASDAIRLSAFGSQRAPCCNGRTLAAPRNPAGGFFDTMQLMVNVFGQSFADLHPGTNTTLGVVAVNAALTKSAATWQTVPAEPDPNNPTAEAGVFDVKSGSDGTALDGSKYAEW